jgi:hypothetical protein
METIIEREAPLRVYSARASTSGCVALCPVTLASKFFRAIQSPLPTHKSLVLLSKLPVCTAVKD